MPDCRNNGGTMKILVCIKQVPGSSNVEVDPVTGVLKRSGVQSKVNPYDLYGIELALTLAERFGAETGAITMGPPQARAAINEAISMGVSHGVVLTDRKFAGADVLATAYTLSQGIKKMGEYDIIICGKQTTDGDTAQVGAELSEYLGIPNVSNVLSVDGISDGKAFVTASLDENIVKMSVRMPCLISVDSDINTPRLPSYKIKKNISEDAVKLITFADFDDKDESHYGLSGSATQVESIFPPEKNTERVTIDESADGAADELLSILTSKKLI